MDKLWAPWRETYLTKVMKKSRGCVFCRIARQRQDRKNLVLVRSQHCFSVLNLYPYNNGHALVLPYRHVAGLTVMTQEERQDFFGLLLETQELLQGVLKPQGYNIGINLGKVAGAGFPGHVHIHIVPRWEGDVNFMPVMTKTKVISQSLAVLWEQLVASHKNRTKAAVPVKRGRKKR